jgi:hypothetical protein
MIVRNLIILALLLLMGCEKKRTPVGKDLSEMSLSERTSKNDPNRKSSYDPNQKSTLTQSKKSSWDTLKEYHSKKVNTSSKNKWDQAFDQGETSYKGQNQNYKDKRYDLEKSNEFNQKQMDLPLYRESDGVYRAADQSYLDKDKTYGVQQNRAAAAAIQKNDTPKIIRPDLEGKQKGKVAYDEATVKQLLQR